MKFLKTFGILVVAFVLVLSGCQEEENLSTNDLEQQKEYTNLTDYQTGDIIPGQYIVILDGEKTKKANWKNLDYKAKRSLMKEEAKSILQRNSISEREFEHVYSSMVQGFSTELTEEEVTKLENAEEVRYIEKDRYVILGPPPGVGPPDNGDEEDEEETSNQTTPWGIQRVNGGVDGSNKIAWIIDTGIDLDHPDLNVDQNRSYSVFTRGRDKDPDDNNGHGSHVAGTIAAVDNDEGVIGVAAGATVVAVKALDAQGSGDYSGIIEAVDYVGANGEDGDVANMSLGGPTSDALDETVLNASQNGIIFSIAAGNDGEDANNYSPANVNGEYVYTISAMDDGDYWATFSNYGNPPIDYCAPGVNIESTWKDGEYNTISGTSMAAPHAAGVLLLGNASTDGNVSGDPDGDPDPIIVH
ncbi:MAG: S8 family serine peptidase [Bacteroidales bacterium]